MTKKKTTPEELNAFLEKEMRALAGEYFEELWEEIEETGLDMDIIAEVLIERILSKIAISQGEENASRLVAHVSKMAEMGILTGHRVLQ